MDKWVDGRVGEWINGWMARLCGWMGKWVDGWMDEGMDEEMDDRWMDGRVAEWINRWMAGLMDRCMDG